MKIHKIILKDYQQFKDLEIDLTYPLGHEKAGQPLDKVCFIGQSGTGKTTLLRLIKFFVTRRKSELHTSEAEIPTEDCKISIRLDEYDYNIYHNKDGQFYMVPPQDLDVDPWYEGRDLKEDEFIRTHRPILISFAAIQDRNPRQSDYLIGEVVSKDELMKNAAGLEQRDFVDFSEESRNIQFQLIRQKIKGFQAKELEHKRKIAELALDPNSSLDQIQVATDSFRIWSANTKSPIAEFALSINPLISAFGVEIKTENDFESIMNLGDVQVRTSVGKVDLSRSSLSTGTRQVIDTCLPISFLKCVRKIILIDEPESSLYPDIQAKIIDFYTKLTTDCQFFYATHSPIIASAFDPWEIVELKFDPTNQFVVQETNYVGERHVDNYTVYPKYQRWDRILMNLFDLKEEGNGNVRQEEMLNAVILKHEIEALVAAGKNKGKAFKDKVEAFQLLCKKLDFYAEA